MSISQEMGALQSTRAEKEIHALPPNNPFVPPTGDTCYINNIPPELLSCIFEVGALDDRSESDDDDDDDEDDDKEEEVVDQGEEEKGDDEEWSDVTSDFDYPSSPFPIVVSHVCRHWRNVALSTPSLWTAIEVTPDARPPYENVSTLLERSKGLPLNIYIDCEPLEQDIQDDADSVDGDVVPSEDNLKFLYSLLVPHVQRWRSIEIAVSSYQQMYAFLSAASDPSVPAASQLAILQLYHHEETDGAENFEHPSLSNHFTLFGGSAPNLTEVSLWGVHVDWDQRWIASASNLRDLTLAYHTKDVCPTWAQLATILRGAPQLDTLSLCGSGPSGEPTEWIFESTPERPTGDLNAPIQLLKLTDFVLAFQSPSCALGLLRKFYTPSLKTLALDFEEDDFTEVINQLVGPATSLSLFSAQEQPRSLLCGLEQLKISGLPCRSEMVETLYSELQNLQSLNISQSYLDQQFIDLLYRPCTLPGRGDILLPRLKSLWIAGASGVTIRRVVQGRKEAGVPLKTLYVEESCVVDEDDVEWFKENLETFDFFEGSDDEDVVDMDDSEGGEWLDVE